MKELMNIQILEHVNIYFDDTFRFGTVALRVYGIFYKISFDMYSENLLDNNEYPIVRRIIDLLTHI